MAVCSVASCDRSTKTAATGGGEPAADAVASGPRGAPGGGVLFVFVDTSARTVHLAGNFNDWSATADPMTRDAQGRWTLVKQLPAGSYRYKFVIDGGRVWKHDPHNADTNDDGSGGKSSVLTVDTGGAPVAGSGSRGSMSAPIGKQPMQPVPAEPPHKVDGGWRFVFDMPAAQSVHLAGSFNHWSATADPLTKDATGRWTIVKELPSGTHQYKFVVNGAQPWNLDPNNPNTTDDGFGGQNSVLVVP
jgi:1,4-alpha-glucan branching enzyme